MYTYVNGEIVRNEKVRISPFDHGFLYGVGVFETFRTYNNQPFLLNEHLARLNSSLKKLHINMKLTSEEVEQILDDLHQANGWDDAYIRLNVSAGEGDIGLQTADYNAPNLLVFQKKLQPPGPIAEKKGQWLRLPRNSPEGADRFKSHHYLNNLFGKWEAGPDPSIEGLFLTEKGHAAEGVVSNLFWVKNGTLFTPSLETGILNGITRQFIMKLARSCGMSVQEGLYTPEEIKSAEEAFVTNSIQEIVPLTEISGTLFPGAHGKAVQTLFTCYRAAVPR